MRILIPVSASDVHLLPDFTAALVNTGGLEDHYVTFVPTPTVILEAKEAASKVEDICPNVAVIPLPEEPIGGWPAGCNNHFAYAAKIAATQQERLPWLWLELDSSFREGWANKLSNAYANLGNNRSFMGFVQPHFRISASTNKPVQAPGDDRMSGVAVYPWDMAERPKFQFLLQDLGYGNRTSGQGFDEYLRFEIKKNVRAHTDLIDDRWNTINYRVEGGQLVCDSGPTEGQSRERGGVVNSQAVLIHGCKDGSLHRLVANGNAPRQSAVAFKKSGDVVTAEVKPESGQPDPVMAALGQLLSKLDGIDSRLKAVEKAPKATVISAPPVVKVSLPESPTDPAHKGSIDVQRLTEFLMANPKGQTVKSAAAHFNVSKSAVEDIVTEEGSGFVVSGVPEWLKLAETANV